MRLLVLNHFFDQDIAALRGALAPGDELVTLDYQHIRAEALRILPAGVEHGLEAFDALRGTPAHDRWVEQLGVILGDEIRRSRCDAVVSPSDTFFYVRDFPDVCHACGVPFIVVIKETTVTDSTMETLSVAMRRHAPPIADAMSVCSERQREFWTRSGADPERIHVLGQPRFDVYAHSRDAPTDGDPPTVLFFSYMLGAYHPSGGDGNRPRQAWADLHAATCDALFDLAGHGWRVVVKPHPQQPLAEALADVGAAAPNVVVAPASADARRLILAADVVVGFQTTAMIEAAVAGKPVVYTGWDPEERRLADRLTPFDEIDPPISVVRDAGQLRAAVEGSRGRRQSRDEQARVAAFAADLLGRIDGRAAKRTVEFLRGQAASFPAPATGLPRPRIHRVAAYRARRAARSAYIGMRRARARRSAEQVV